MKCRNECKKARERKREREKKKARVRFEVLGTNKNEEFSFFSSQKVMDSNINIENCGNAL